MITGRISVRTVRIVDVALVVWFLLCLMLGVAVGRRVDRLQALGEGVIDAGQGVSNSADALDGLTDLPLVGGSIQAVADQIRSIGASTVDKGEAGKVAVFRLALSIGALITLAPTLPLLVVWLPLRIAWERERQSIRRALVFGDPGIRAYLAHRTVSSRPYRDLTTITADPWGDLQAERFDALAGVELKRLGLATVADSSPPYTGPT